jgi:predicted transcriptional regulator
MEHLSFIRKVASVLNLSKTDVEILRALARGKKLLLTEIAEGIKRSDRHVRQRLHFLVGKGVLEKEIEVLKNKRLAYRYSLRSIKKIVDELRTHLVKKIHELDEFITE